MTFSNGEAGGARDAAGGPVLEPGRKPTFSAFYRAVFLMVFLWPLEWGIFGALFRHHPNGGKIVDAIVLASFLLAWFLIHRAMRGPKRAHPGRQA